MLIIPKGFRPNVGRTCRVKPWLPQQGNMAPRLGTVIHTSLLSDVPIGRPLMDETHSMDADGSVRSGAPIIGYFIKFDDEDAMHPEMISAEYVEFQP